MASMRRPPFAQSKERILAKVKYFTLASQARNRYPAKTATEAAMGIDKQSDIAANLQIGPTDQGMVRIYVEAEGGIELPLDFDPEEAEEIAEELRAAAEAARAMGEASRKRR
jgi:hypothetical protein